MANLYQFYSKYCLWTALALPGESIEMQSFRSHSWHLKSESRALNQVSVFNQLSDDTYENQSLKNTCLVLKKNQAGYLLKATKQILFSSTVAGERES